ncbi:unnamed protein product [Spirodela intermedia]|uniref:Uncharacterized protein n=1 Tax=Spirodela intermedia TaxID=51605 RepID=A0A7I8JN12_SPIIN|nr:unnamed protein product [Spirodela intermedia]CAA6671519.1 unnamed protein product [Spirodela intermedia]
MEASDAPACCHCRPNKGSPKLDHYLSSCTKKHPDSKEGTSEKGTDRPESNSIPLIGDPRKWWLQLQPKLGYRKDITVGLPSVLEELENCAIPTSEFSWLEGPIAASHVDGEKKPCSSETSRMISSNNFMHINEVKEVHGYFQEQNQQKAILGAEYQNGDLVDWMAYHQISSKKPDELCPNLQSSSIISEKTEPWWRIAGKDELALLVAQKSWVNVENSDLPQPLKIHVFGEPSDYLESFDDNHSLDPFLDKSYASKYDASSRCTSGSMDGKYQTSDSFKKLKAGEHHPERDPTKAELLEALCHFQTCARKAELAAQQAHIEKQHIGKLFLMETSHLLKYRHWIRMLQSECFSLRLMFEEHHTSLFPFSWTPLNGGVPSGRCAPKAKGKGRHNTQRGNIWRYALAFLAGLGLSCAGLLLGLVLS